MKYRSFQLGIGVLTALVSGACATMRRSSGDVAPDSAVVYFSNGSLNEADVYAVSPTTGGTRIGTVMAGRTEALPIPRVAMSGGSIVVVARIVAHSNFVGTAPFSVHAGDQLSVRLPSEDSPNLIVLPATDRDSVAATRRPPR